MFVVKIGGASGNDLDRVLDDLADSSEYVVVHGGSDAATRLAERLGKQVRFVTSVSGYRSRYTDRETLGIFTMALQGDVNARIVEGLQRRGVNAIGLSGVDGRLLTGRRKAALKIVEGGKRKVLRDDLSGVVDHVDAGLLRLLMGAGYVPVIGPPILDPTEGTALNADADRAAAKVAAALGADELVVLTNVPGLLRNPDDAASLIADVPRADLATHLERTASGGMKKKLLAALEGVEAGVPRICIGDSRLDRPVTRARKGEGTVVR